MATDLVVAMLEVDVAEVEVVFRVELPDGLTARVEEVRRKTREAEELQSRPAEELREAVAALRDRTGPTVQDISEVLGVSPQRVSQLGAKLRPAAAAHDAASG
jgi:hypothetical protein